MGGDMEKEITIEVPEEVAQAYEKASASDRKRAQRALAYSLMSREEVADELKEIFDRTGKTAKERGLTKDKLNQLLSEHGDSMDQG
jgi:TFIIF-interacting CTD phosphatase-like protein